MLVRVRDAETFEQIDVRWSGELAEEYGLTDDESDSMDDELAAVGRYWLTTVDGVGIVYLTKWKPMPGEEKW